MDIRLNIGVTNIRARFTIDVRGCTDNPIRTSVILQISKRIFKRISKRTVQPSLAQQFGRHIDPFFKNAVPDRPFKLCQFVKKKKRVRVILIKFKRTVSHSTAMMPAIGRLLRSRPVLNRHSIYIFFNDATEKM